jgi:type II secretory pathway pseudopilin PulG
LTLLELLIVLTILVALGTLIVPTISYLGKRSQRLATRENLCRIQELIVDRYLVDMEELPRPVVDPTSGDVLEPGSVSGNRANHPQLRYLFVNPDMTYDSDDYNDQNKGEILSVRSWKGPYLLHTGGNFDFDDADADNFGVIYGEPGDPVILDAWGHPIVLQQPTETPAGYTDPDDILRIQKMHVRLVSAGPDGELDTPPEALRPDDTSVAGVGRDDDLVVFLFRHDEYGDEYLGLEED